MASFVSAQTSRVLAAEFDLDYVTSVNMDVSRNLLDVTVMRPGGTLIDMERIAGIGDGSVSVSGFFDADSGKSDEQLNTALTGAAYPLTVSWQGATVIGQRAMLFNVRQNSSPLSGGSGNAVELSSERLTDGARVGGVVLKEHAAETSIGDYTSVDNAASTTFGSVGNLHVTAFTGTDATIKITDSTDDAVFADHITFTQATAVTSERVAVTGTVNRYARVELTGTFTTITFAVAFGRLTL